jgi:YYY domain-containing protein
MAMVYFLIWYLVISIIGLLSLPLIQYLLPSLKDRGYAFSRVFGLMLTGFIFWVFTSYHVMQNDSGGILLALILLSLLSIGISKKNPLKTLKGIFLDQKGYLITTEILFLLLFVLIALLRAASPDITGTEKPMELAFINAILHSTTFPPNDPWLAGYSISYYYFGYVITAMLIKLTATPSGIGFNLMISLVFSLTGIGMYGLVYNIINSDGVKNWLLKLNGKQGLKETGTNIFLLPLFGPLFTLVISNFEGIFEFMHSRGLFWAKGVDGTLQSPFWKWLDLQELTQAPTYPFSWWPTRPAGIIWWRASRVLSDYKMNGEWLEIIDEFPFFSFLLADLHPHVLALPFVTLMLALALNIFLTIDEKGFSIWGIEVHIPPINLAFFTILLGGMAFLNTWDFPVYLAIFLAAYFARRMFAHGFKWDEVWKMISLGILMVAGSILLYLPFYIGFSSQAGGVIPSMVFSTRGTHFWMMFGTLLVPIFTFVLYLALQQKPGKGLLKGLLVALGVLVVLWVGGFGLGLLAANSEKWSGLLPGNLGLKLSEAGYYFLNIQGAEGAAIGQLVSTSFLRRLSAPGTWITLLLLGTLISAILLIPRKFTLTDVNKFGKIDSIPMGVVFILLIIVTGIFLTLIPEFVYLRDQFGWRMNTIFKFYYQAWVLWSLAASVGIALLWMVVHHMAGVLSKILIVLVVLCGLAYPIIGIANTTNNFQPVNGLNLDGTAYMEKYNPDEAEAIKWLSQAPFGFIVEAVGGSYSSFARVATLSGMPGVLGWPPHESQWRGGADEIGNREPDIERLYSTPDWLEAKDILDLYKVKYIYVGGLEHTKYQVDELKFIENLVPVFQNQSVTIYSYNGNLK